jgi:large conductance mechanosensitive channel
MLKEFKKFLLRGNVIDLAVGVIIGAAFNGIVSSLVKDIFTPFIGLLTVHANLTDLHYQVSDADVSYGNFLQAIVVFLITAFALYLLVALINRMRQEKKVESPAPAPEPPADIKLLTEIRDLLKNRSL